MSSITPLSFISTIFAKLYLSHQVDVLHLSIVNLLEMIKSEEIDLILSQTKKSIKQKKSFLQKIIETCESKELRTALQEVLDGADLDFFEEKNLKETLNYLQSEAERIVIVRLTLGCDFKEPEMRSFAGALQKKIGKPVAINSKIDGSLLGGVIVQYGNYISDYSLKSRLNQLRDQWKLATLEKHAH